MRVFSEKWSAVVVGVAVAACGNSESGSQNQSTSTGGTSNQAGRASQTVGGSVAIPAGGSQSGGATSASGNSQSGGGASASASASAPGSPSGGSNPSGGTSQSGGNTASSGATLGGSKAAGGNGTTTSAGNLGSPSGGATAAGGRTTAAGSTATGGTAGGAAGTIASGGAGTCTVPSASPGTIITFNDDGGWCWYQDERVIVDTVANKLIIGSVATGSSRNGQIEVAMYDLAKGGTPQRSGLGKLNPDDHNAPALLKVSDGKYVAVYTTHNDDCFSYYNLYENGKWGTQNKFDWTSLGCPTPNEKTVSYSNLWQMPGTIYNFVRSVETSPNLITSTDGAKWTFAGRLSSTPRVGYVAGYYKYWGNGVDRIDFLATEAHPRDEDNSLYHGYVKDGKSYNSAGIQQGTISVATKGSAPDITKFTKVFATGTTINGVKLIHMWNSDITRYEDGTIVAIGQGRANTDTTDPDKRFIYMRFDGSAWKTTYLVNAGKKLYDSEQDYTGLGAVHPNDPNTIYISTVYDPRDDKTTSSKHEIWRGTTCDKGKTFTWTPITQNSTQDNLRPVVPFWPGGKTALLWERGSYASAQTYSTSIVGLILDGS